MERTLEENRNLILQRSAATAKKQKKYKLATYLGFILLVFIAHFFFPPFYQGLFIEMMIFALLAMSLDLLLGYTGMFSFGHAAFFGLGIYATAYMMNAFALPFFLSMAIGVLITVAAAFLIGLVCARLNGMQFAMLTMAFGQLIWTIAVKWRSVTNGLDGFTVSKGTVMELGGATIVLTKPSFLLFFTAVILVVSYWSMQRIVHSPFGKAMSAIKENEERSVFLGFNQYRVKVQVFVIGAFYAALAGGCFVLLKTFVAPDYMTMGFSGNILMMALLGGLGTLAGPMLGAAVFVGLQDWLSSMTENWMGIIGLLFVLVVIYLPKGVFGWLFRR